MITHASQDTNFGKADDKLTRIISALVQIYQYQSEAFEDIKRWHAPSECYAIVIRQTKNKKEMLFEQEDMTEREFSRKIRERISNRWIYYNLNIHEEETE